MRDHPHVLSQPSALGLLLLSRVLHWDCLYPAPFYYFIGVVLTLSGVCMCVSLSIQVLSCHLSWQYKKGHFRLHVGPIVCESIHWIKPFYWLLKIIYSGSYFIKSLFTSICTKITFIYDLRYSCLSKRMAKSVNNWQS